MEGLRKKSRITRSRPDTSTVHFELEFLRRGAVEMPGQPGAHGAPPHQVVGQEGVEVMNAVKT
jgi:hypothetical protein